MEKLVDQTYEPVIGVDIGPDAIRVVEIERVGREYYLRNFGIAPTPAGSMQEGRIVNPRAVGRVLREIFHDRRFSHRTVVGAVRGAKVVSRLITLPAMPHDRLRRLIESEIDRYVLFGSQDKIVYYHPLEEFEEQGRRNVSIMLVIAERNLCYSYYQALNEAGLECAALDVSSFSILRVLRNSTPVPPMGNFMSVVYDFQGISMNVFHGDTIRYSRTVKLTHMDPLEMQNGFLDKILSEVLLTLHYYQTEFARGGRIQKMTLSLGATGGMDLYHMLAQHIEDVPIEMHSPFSNIKVNVDEFPSELMDKVDLNFLTAVGLAIRGVETERLPFSVDLLPTEIAELQRLRKFAVWLLAALLAVAAITGFFWYGMNQTLKEQTATNQKAQIRYNANEAILSELRPKAERMQQLPRVNAANKVTIPFNTLLLHVAEAVPKTVQLEELHLQEHAPAPGTTGRSSVYDVTMAGFTTDSGAIKDFKDKLTDPALFFVKGTIEPGSVETQQIDDITVNRFTVRGQWEEQP